MTVSGPGRATIPDPDPGPAPTQGPTQAPTQAPNQARVRRPRGRPRDPYADERITTAAAELLLRHGFDGTTVDEVAERAGVGKATVYRRWPSKEDLAVAAMETLYESEFPEPDTGSIEQDLTESYRAVLAFANSPQGHAYLRTTVSESVRDDRIAALHRASTERRESYHRQTIQRGIERGEVRPDIDMDAAVQWLGGLIVTRVVTHRAMPRLEDVPRLVRFALRGMGS
ncbi:MAG: TetR/AcrR family transcriptional regulator [Nocardioidaceae bacterium]